jgi:hypothetical protein
MRMRERLSWWRNVGFAALIFSSVCWGASGPALVVHDGTPGIEADVLANVTGKLTAAGYTVSASVGVPGGSLAANKQIWDIRFNNTTPLTASDVTAYGNYLIAGGVLFLDGENTGFATRNASIVNFVAQAGGGNIIASTGAINAQVVQSPFTGPTAVTNITILAGAAVTSPGFGALILKDTSSSGSGIGWGPGSLGAAPTGTLIAVFDVNFLQAGADAASQALSNNIVAFMAAPTSFGTPAPRPQDPVSSAAAVPTLTEWGMVLLALGLALVASRRLAKVSSLGN